MVPRRLGMTLHWQEGVPRMAPAVLQPWAIPLLAALVWAGCSQSSTSKAVERSSASGPRVRVTDGIGRDVSVKLPARRIVALSPSNVEILFAVGCGDRVVLRDRASDYPPAARALPATNAFHLSAEHIAGYRPNLVLVSHLDPSRVATLEALGIPVAVFDPHQVETVFSDILTIGRLCGATKRAESLVRDLRARLGRVQREVAGLTRHRVYVELDGSDPLKPWTAGARSLVDDVIRLAGGTNVFGDVARSAVQVSAEAVLWRSPAVVLLANGARTVRSTLANRPAWGRMPAIRAGRIIDGITPALLSRPGPRIVSGVEALARALHPHHHAVLGRR
jgi:ABC-type Fe3+-hydroxamate transport system substrate-binding protein